VLALAGLPARAGTNISINFGGGNCRFYGNSFAAAGPHCGYSTYGFTPYRACGYVGYPGCSYAGYGYSYGAYAPVYYTGGYTTVAYVQPAPPIQAPVQAPAPTPAPAPQPVAAPTPAPAPAPAPEKLPFGILDVNGFVHSPYSDAIFKVPDVRNAQMVYDPVTGKPFLVR